MTSEWITKITLYLASSNVNHLVNRHFVVCIVCVKVNRHYLASHYTQKQAPERVMLSIFNLKCQLRPQSYDMCQSILRHYTQDMWQLQLLLAEK